MSGKVGIEEQLWGIHKEARASVSIFTVTESFTSFVFPTPSIGWSQLDLMGLIQSAQSHDNAQKCIPTTDATTPLPQRVGQYCTSAWGFAGILSFLIRWTPLRTLLDKPENVTDVSEEYAALPTSIELWKSKALDEDGFGWQWEILRPFFLRKGYDLYVSRGCHGLKAREDTDPAANSFDLYGVRENFSKKPLFASFHAEIWGARDRENRDVVIKPVSYGDNPSNELQILKYLNSDATCAEQMTATVPIIEFIEHSGWTFAVMPRWSDSTYPEFVNIGEVLDWAVQLIDAVAFLHRHNIAHLDISHENVLMNFWGVVPPSRNYGTLAPELRNGFPVKYAVIDFGHSVNFSADSDSQSRRGTWPVPREQSAPETKRRTPFDPFAADVYQTGRTIYGWCQKFEEDVPEVLAVLQDMTRRRPEYRPTAAESLAQMRAAEKTVLPATKVREVPISLLGEFSPVPSRRRMYIYGHSPY